MIRISKTLGELIDSIVSLQFQCNSKAFPTEFQTYEEAWEQRKLSIDSLLTKLGVSRHAQLIDMLTQAKAHYDAESQDSNQGYLASWLMQDIEQVIKNKPPFAYPEDLYRWTK
jgi:hypothetical protein